MHSDIVFFYLQVIYKTKKCIKRRKNISYMDTEKKTLYMFHFIYLF